MSSNLLIYPYIHLVRVAQVVWMNGYQPVRNFIESKKYSRFILIAMTILGHLLFLEGRSRRALFPSAGCGA
jgi:hypothetical protein